MSLIVIDNLGRKSYYHLHIIIDQIFLFRTFEEKNTEITNLITTLSELKQNKLHIIEQKNKKKQSIIRNTMNN